MKREFKGVEFDNITFRQENIIVIIMLVAMVAASVFALIRVSGYRDKMHAVNMTIDPIDAAVSEDVKQNTIIEILPASVAAQYLDGAENADMALADAEKDVAAGSSGKNATAGTSGDRIAAIEESIYSTLVSSGYTPAAACGILGNISIEDGSFEADLSGNKGKTYGLFQWTDTGDRRNKMLEWCRNRDLPSDSYEGQVAFAMYELEGGDVIACRMENYLKDTKDPKMAAMEFAAGFERCVGRTHSNNGDAAYLGKIYDEYYGRTYQALGRRVGNASDYYDRFKDMIIDEEDILDTTPNQFTIDIVSDRETQLANKAAAALRVNEKTDALHLWLYRIFSALSGYVCGCILGAAIIARHFRKKSIYELGTGVPGFRNTLAHVGKSEALMVLLSDILKTMLAFVIGYLISGGALGSEQILWSGLGVILGNDYPVWSGFKGGMGVVVTIITLVFYMPVWGPLCCLAGLIVALALKSFPVGAVVIGLMAVPFAFHFKGVTAGIMVALLLLILLQRHYKIIIKHFRRSRGTGLRGGVRGDGIA